MAREMIEIPVTGREIGKHNSRTSRVGGKVPAVVYGPKTKPMNVLADEVTLRKYQGRKFESVIFNLKNSESGAVVPVILRDIQIHPVSRRPIHVDFYAPDMTKPVRLNVNIILEGKPAGFADGGKLEHMLHSLEIEVLPNAIPEVIVADVSHLGVTEALHVSDLKLADGIKIISLPTLTIATVAIPKEEEAATPAPAAAAAAPAAAPAKK